MMLRNTFLVTALVLSCSGAYATESTPVWCTDTENPMDDISNGKASVMIYSNTNQEGYLAALLSFNPMDLEDESNTNFFLPLQVLLPNEATSKEVRRMEDGSFTLSFVRPPESHNLDDLFKPVPAELQAVAMKNGLMETFKLTLNCSFF